MGEKPVKNHAGQLSLDEEAKKEAWREHYERLLNVEFPWNPEDLSEESPVEGPSEPITLEMITKAISKMASGKAAGPSGIVAEMLKPVGEAGAMEVRDLIEDIISEGCIPTDWQESFIINLYKGKGDALNRGNYRRSTWLPTSRSTWPSSTWRKHLIKFHVMSSGGQCAN